MSGSRIGSRAAGCQQGISLTSVKLIRNLG
ncbi:MAG: hypothetical protein ACI9VS_000227 [Candidatus Binatia bacterium]|jgi:hypothetical protein